MNTLLPLDTYPIDIGTDWTAFNAWLNEQAYARVAVLMDTNTRRDCWPYFAQQVALKDPLLIEVPAGELHKNIQTCTHIWQALLDGRADRRSLLINLGGGVVTDMGGFCAATFKRGMDFVQVPTTLLSQVDASIGGKLGIDFGDVKNSIGVFQNPQRVQLDPTFLRTLPERELRSGLAEIYKHALIQDAEQWARLRELTAFTPDQLTPFLIDSLQIKRRIVTEDPFERGIRKALNFGHTIGHAVESYALGTSTPLLHGEAIAVGMIAEAYLSHRQLALSEAALSDITATLLRTYGNYALPEGVDKALLALMRNDKKNEGAAINFSLLPAIGEVAVNQTANPVEIENALAYYRNVCA